MPPPAFSLQHPTDPAPEAASSLPGSLDAVGQILAALTPASRGWRDTLLVWITGAVNRDGLLARYGRWQAAQASGDGLAQWRAAGELRAAFERFQDTCSVDDHIRAQEAYPPLDATLEHLRAQLQAQGRAPDGRF